MTITAYNGIITMVLILVEVALVISILSDIADMEEEGRKEAVPKRTEPSVFWPTGRMVNNHATVI